MKAVVAVKVLSEISRIKIKQLDVAATERELDLLEEIREKVAIKMMAYKRRATEYFNQRVRPRVFQPGDLVLRDTTTARHPNKSSGQIGRCCMK